MKTIIEDGVLTIILEEKMDGTNSEKIREEMEDLIKAHPDMKLIFDADELEYISSAGIRVLLYVQNYLVKEKLTILNVNRDVYDIFEMTGFTEIMNVERKLRSISVSDAEVIGKGRSSTVYRIGEETIIKLYTEGVPLTKIKQELYLAKKSICGRNPDTYFV